MIYNIVKNLLIKLWKIKDINHLKIISWQNYGNYKFKLKIILISTLMLNKKLIKINLYSKLLLNY